MHHHRLAIMIGAIVCAAIFPLVLFAVFLTFVAIADARGVDINPPAGIMFLSIAMTRTYPALLISTLIVGLPVIRWALNERSLPLTSIFVAGMLASCALAVGTVLTIEPWRMSMLLATFNAALLAIPLLLCFGLFACWVQLVIWQTDSNQPSSKQQLSSETRTS